MFESTEMQLIQFEAEQKNLNDNVSSEEKKNKQTKKKNKEKLILSKLNSNSSE